MLSEKPEESLELKVSQLQSELEDRDQHLALFKEVVAAVRDRLDMETIYKMVADVAQWLLKAESTLIPVLDEEGTSYTYRACTGSYSKEIVGENFNLDWSICGWVLKHQIPWWQGVLEELSSEEKDHWKQEIGNVIMVPMIGQHGFLGGIAGVNKIGGGGFNQRDLDLLTLLASEMAIAIENNHLIEELRQANQALFGEKEKAQVTLSSIGDAVITTDVEGNIEYLNPVAEQLFDIPLAEARAMRLTELATLLFEKDRQPVEGLIASCLHEGLLLPEFHSLILMRHDGREVYIEPNAATIHGHDREPSGVALVFRDVTQARELSRQLSYQSTHDILTGLFSRQEFEYQVGQAIRDAQVSGKENSLLHMDIDQFKVINDTCGHVAGDELLKLYSTQLLELLRKGDILARVGGDEFGLLLESCSVQQAQMIADKIQKMTRDFRFVWAGNTFTVGVSIGLIGIGHGEESVTAILSHVDAACHMAKENGRNNICVHDEEDQALHARHGEMQWTPRITKALEEGRMVLFYQPIARRSAMTDLSSHYEILIRMQDEAGGLIPPGAFLPAAERYNLIAAIDQWVISTYFQWLAEHPAHLSALEFGSVNLSGRSLGDGDCLIHIENCLREFSIPPEKICFEITETEAIGNLTKAQYFIERLKNLGCSFALDDFGSGLSSYAYLKNLPVDFLKIDGMFVKDLVSDRVNHAMVDSINQIGHVMGRKTIAEFVENDAIVKILGELNVDYLQGYGIAKPRPLSELN